jgi:A/G-specific adenine glycosylase
MHFSARLLSWFSKHRRPLPWRDTKNPYAIWISEVILQQTRMEQGIQYYLQFIDAFPDVAALARAKEEEVLRLWQGLGYYSRARNLHQAARSVWDQRGGRLPGTYREWLSLKGVGPYTAAAIASIAQGEAVAALDGNAYRVLSRIFALDANIDTGPGRKTFQQLAEDLLDPAHPGDFNQALMDFGSAVCKPVRPLCTQCIFSRECLAFKGRAMHNYPVRQPRKKTRPRYFNYFFFYSSDRQRFFIQKRAGEDIWKNLFELPLLESPEPLTAETLTEHPWWRKLFPAGKGAVFTQSPLHFRHQLTHQTIHACFFNVRLDAEQFMELEKVFVPSDKNKFEALPKPRLVDRYLQHLGRGGRLLWGTEHAK